MPRGLTLSQFSVLNHFVRLGRIESPARLANAFQVTRGAMTNTLGKLERSGLIHIEPNPDDGRAKLVEITDKGRTVHHECITAIAPVLKTHAATMGVDSLTNMLPHLEHLRKYLDEMRE